MNTTKFNRTYILLLLTALILSVGACDKKSPAPEENPQEQRLELLSKTWHIENGSITLDGADVSTSYEGFQISFSNGVFSTQAAGELFPINGTWSWIDNAATMLKTGRGKEINLVSISDSKLVIRFYKTSENAVTGAIGDYVIELNP